MERENMNNSNSVTANVQQRVNRDELRQRTDETYAQVLKDVKQMRIILLLGLLVMLVVLVKVVVLFFKQEISAFVIVLALAVSFFTLAYGFNRFRVFSKLKSATTTQQRRDVMVDYNKSFFVGKVASFVCGLVILGHAIDEFVHDNSFNYFNWLIAFAFLIIPWCSERGTERKRNKQLEEDLKFLSDMEE